MALFDRYKQFKQTNLKNVYNLAFGDKDQNTGDIDDTVISNNEDSEKVLATVVATVYALTDKYPDAFFTRLVALKQEHVYIEWEFQNF